MDVVLHPAFAQNRLVYFSYSEAGPGGKGVVLEVLEAKKCAILFEEGRKVLAMGGT